MEKNFNTPKAPSTGWTKDILGKDFERRTVVQPSDYDGPVCCTIVRLTTPDGLQPSRGVLYVHGFSDYFFQTDMARKFRDEGYAFYAVDLRKYGRAVLTGQKFFKVHDLREYFPDIMAAISQMESDGIEEVILLAHSTGGLTCSLFMKECPPPQVKAMVLNSPFLAWNMPPFMRRLWCLRCRGSGSFFLTFLYDRPVIRSMPVRCIRNMTANGIMTATGSPIFFRP